MYPREYFDIFWRPNIRNEVFVALSFAPEFNDAWTLMIEPGIRDAGLTPHRVDATRISGSIVVEIMECIAHARVVLGEISVMATGQRNGNVMYEIGLAHALRQAEEVVLVRHDNERIAFDIAAIRVHQYDVTNPAASRTEVADLVRNAVQSVDVSRNLKVQQAKESFDDVCLVVIRDNHSRPSFGFNVPANAGQILASVPVRLSIAKLLDLGLIRTNFNTAAGKYAYHWTPFGKIVIQSMGYQVSW